MHLWTANYSVLYFQVYQGNSWKCHAISELVISIPLLFDVLPHEIVMVPSENIRIVPSSTAIISINAFIVLLKTASYTVNKPFMYAPETLKVPRSLLHQQKKKIFRFYSRAPIRCSEQYYPRDHWCKESKLLYWRNKAHQKMFRVVSRHRNCHWTPTTKTS